MLHAKKHFQAKNNGHNLPTKLKIKHTHTRSLWSRQITHNFKLLQHSAATLIMQVCKFSFPSLFCQTSLLYLYTVLLGSSSQWTHWHHQRINSKVKQPQSGINNCHASRQTRTNIQSVLFGFDSCWVRTGPRQRGLTLAADKYT